MKINIIDAICGAGKTSAAINYINNSTEDQHFLYITPYLTEVERIISACPNKKFKIDSMDIQKCFKRRKGNYDLYPKQTYERIVTELD